MKSICGMAILFAAFVLTGFSCSKDKDENEPKKKEGKSMELNTSNESMWTYVNLETGDTCMARDFSAWNYYKVDMKKGTKTLLSTKPAEGKESDLKLKKWHLAFHYYDIKTNGGEAVVVKDAKSIGDVKKIPGSGFEGDVEIKDKLVVDKKGMMRSEMGYAANAMVNEVLGGWVKKLGGMPPEYELKDVVFVVKFKEGGHAVLKFTDYRNNFGKNGHVKFSYDYVK